MICHLGPGGLRPQLFPSLPQPLGPSPIFYQLQRWQQAGGLLCLIMETYPEDLMRWVSASMILNG